MLIDSDGEKLGLLAIDEALEEAQKKNLDLVQVSASDAQPLVCKLLDFGKFQFEKKKSTVGTKRPKKQSLKETIKPCHRGRNFTVTHKYWS